MKKSMLIVGALFLSGSVFAAASVNSVIVRQQWPWNNKVNIDFLLTDSESNPHDISLVLKNGTAVIPYDREDVVGDFENLQPGVHRLVWNPAKVDAKVLDSLTATIEVDDDPKKYLVLDLSGGYSADAQIPHAWMSRPPAEGWFRTDTDYTYRGNYLVFRHIKAGTFTMGSPDTEPGRNTQLEGQRQVTLTKDFYIGIIPLTALQAKNIFGSTDTKSGYAPSDYNPLAFVSIKYLRGANCRVNWPAVDSDSFCGVLNTRTAFRASELPGYEFEVRLADGMAILVLHYEMAVACDGDDVHPIGEVENKPFRHDAARGQLYLLHAEVHPCAAVEESFAFEHLPRTVGEFGNHREGCYICCKITYLF